MQTYDDTLSHYGILGMKWGHRKSQVDGVENETQKSKKMNPKTKRNLIIGVAVGATIVAGILAVHGATKISDDNVKKYMSSINTNSINIGKYKVDKMSMDTIIPKGQTMNRVTRHVDLKDGSIYASINKEDNRRYIHRMTEMYKHDQMFNVKLKAVKDIKIPSEQKQMDMFVDLLVNNKEFSEKVAHNPYGKTESLFGNREAAMNFAKDYHYDNFITRMIDYNPIKQNKKSTREHLLSTYVDYVKSQGYNGLIDTNDIRTTSSKPIIALDKDDLVVDAYNKITKGSKIISGLFLKSV